MRIAPVTGAGRGIGREIARQLAEHGMTVLAGVRDESHAPEGTRPLLLDVTGEAAVANAAKVVREEFGRLDVLVNNAAICGDLGTPPAEVTAEHMRATYEVGVFGVVAVTHAMLPLLRASGQARVVNMTTRLASLALTSAGDGVNAEWAMPAYNSAKSALNAITVLYANELDGSGILVNAVDPGHCATDLTGHTGTRTAARGAAVAVRMATLDAGGPTGTFSSEEDRSPGSRTPGLGHDDRKVARGMRARGVPRARPTLTARRTAHRTVKDVGPVRPSGWRGMSSCGQKVANGA